MHIEAEEASAAGLADAIAKYYHEHPAHARPRVTFPIHRPRRLRRTEALRGFVRETRLSTSGLVYPMFACPGNKVRNEVSSMPGVYQQSPDQIVEECREVADLGIPAVILFGLPEQKDETGSEAASPTAPSSAPSTRFAKRSSICSSSPTFASANTPATAIVA